MEKRSTPSLQITDRFGAQTAFASLRLPDGTETTVPAEHAAAIYVNEQPAFRVVCTPALLPQLFWRSVFQPALPLLIKSSVSV